MVYTLKNWGIIMFGIGEVCIGIYILNIILQFLGPGHFIVDNDKDNTGCIYFWGIFFEIVVSMDFFSRIIYFFNFSEEYPDTITDILLEKVIMPAFITRLIVVWMIYILGAIFYYKNRPTARPLPQLPNVNGILVPLDITFELKGIQSPDVNVFRKNASVMFCTICLNELQAEADDVVKIIKCGHLFHRICLTEWASKHKSCPMCRGNLE